MPLVNILSAERFATYQAWANGDDELARRLYTYNVQLSAALYGPLHMLEISLRNVSDQRMTGAYGLAWLNDPVALPQYGQRTKVAHAASQLQTQSKAGTHAQMVAELSFGFWASLYSRKSHHLWQHLRHGFQTNGLQRGRLWNDLDALRNLRNRIAHYEPIVALPLGQLYGTLTTLAGWLSADGAAWIAATSSWPQIYPGVPLLVPDGAGHLHIEPGALPYLPQ